MTPFRLDYTDDADNELARAWLGALDRAAVTRWHEQIEKLLGQDPIQYGKQLGEGLWRIDVGKLAAFFELDEQNHVVTFTGFGLISHSGNGKN